MLFGESKDEEERKEEEQLDVRKIIYCSRTHTQLSQFMREVKVRKSRQCTVATSVSKCDRVREVVAVCPDERFSVRATGAIAVTCLVS